MSIQNGKYYFLFNISRMSSNVASCRRNQPAPRRTKILSSSISDALWSPSLFTVTLFIHIPTDPSFPQAQSLDINSTLYTTPDPKAKPSTLLFLPSTLATHSRAKTQSHPAPGTNQNKSPATAFLSIPRIPKRASRSPLSRARLASRWKRGISAIAR